MALVDELRKQNPKLQNLSDRQIAEPLRRHPDFQGMDEAEFNAQVLGIQPEPQQQNDGGPGFTGGVKAGLNQLQAMGGGLQMLAGDALDNPGWVRSGRESYQRNMQEAAETSLDYGFTDLFTDPETSTWEWAKFTAGNLLPVMATSIASGGVGGVAAGGGARLLAGATIKESAKRLGQTIGAAAGSTAMGAGEIMGQTEDLETTLAHAPIIGALDALTPIRALRAMGKSGLADKAASEISDGVQADLRRQAGRGTLRAAGGGSALNLMQEMSTEGLQNLVEQHAGYWAENNASLLGDVSEVDLKAMVDEAAAGGLMGGLMGGPVGLGERGQARRDVARIEAARQQAAAQGGDALDQAMAGQEAETVAQAETSARPAMDPQAAAEVGNQLHLTMGELDDLQHLAKGASYQGQTRLRNMDRQLKMAEEQYEAGNLEGARRRLMSAQRLGKDLRASLSREGTAERPARREGELVGEEQSQQRPAGLLGQDGRRLPPGDPDTIFAGGPTADQTQYDHRARNVRRDEGLAVQRQGSERLREQVAVQRPQIPDQGIVYGEGPVAGNANTGLDQPFADPRFTDTGARQEAEVGRARQQQEAARVAELARTRGRGETAYLPDNTPVRTRFRVMDAGELRPSNTPDGRINPDYPQELQPRDRTNANSQVQVRNIAARLNPERLGSSRDAGTGAPIIGSDGVVESGNGRAMAITQAYQQGGPQARAYRDAVRRQAEEQGIDPAAVDEMERPVLVRERVSNIDRADFARRANESQVAGMTAYEQAMGDADSLTADDLQSWAPDQSGDPLAASNRAFQRAFVQRLGNNEAARYTTRDGQAGAELGSRMQRAVFAKAYQDADMVEMATEQGDQMRNLVTALQAAAPDLALAQETGSRDALDAIGTINDAVRILRNARQDGISVRELTRQTDAFSEPVPETTALLAVTLRNNLRSRRALTEAMRYIGQAVRTRAESERNGALFEDTTTNEDVFNAAFQAQDQDQRAAKRSPEGDVRPGAERGEREPAQGRETEAAPGDAAGQQADAVDDAPLLASYDEQELADREQTQRQAEQAEADRRLQEEQRAQADAEADDFRLSGSDRAADVAAAGGQQDLMSAQPTQEPAPTQQAEGVATRDEPSSSPTPDASLQYRANGEPFASARSAEASKYAKEARREGRRVEAVEVEGGVVLSIESEQARVSRERETILDIMRDIGRRYPDREYSVALEQGGAAKRVINALGKGVRPADIRDRAGLTTADMRAAFEEGRQGAPAEDAAQQSAPQASPRDTLRRAAHETLVANPHAEFSEIRQAMAEAVGEPGSPSAARRAGMSLSDMDELIHDVRHAIQMERARQNPVPITPELIGYDLGEQAARGTHMMAEKAGRHKVDGHVLHMLGAWDKLARLARTDGQKAVLAEEFKRYRSGYVQRVKAQLERESRTMSTMITGAGNFNVERNNKKLRSAEKALDDLETFDEKAQKAMRKRLRNTNEDGSQKTELQQARERLEAAEQAQEQMKAANRIIRSDKDVDRRLVEEAGLTEQQATDIQQPNALGDTGFPAYTLRNNNARLKQARQRVAELEALALNEQEAATGELATEHAFEGGRLKMAIEDQRLRLHFDEKPTEEVRTRLKARGFRWSRKHGAWQRKLTRSAIQVGADIAGLDGQAIARDLDSDPRFSLGGSDTRPPQAEDVAAMLEEHPELADARVIQTVRELPPKALLGMALRGVDPADVRGMYIGGELYVVADNLESAQEGLEVAVHEAVGHKGIRGVLGEDLDRVMLDLYRSLPNSKEGRAALAEVRRDYPFLDPAKREDRITIGEEMVAHLLEKGARPKAWQRAVAKLRELLRRVFPMVGWTYTDVLALGEKSRDYLRRQQAEQEGEDVQIYSLRGKQRVAFEQAFDDFTDADQAAAQKIGEPTVVRSAMQWWKEKTDRWRAKVRQGVVDQYGPLMEQDLALYGDEATTEQITQSAWVKARMSKSANGVAEVLLKNSRIEWNAKEQVFQPKDDDSMGLGAVLGQLGDAAEIHRFLGWIAGNRADKLRAEGRENLFDDGDIDAMKDWDRGSLADGQSRREAYGRVFKEFQQYRDDVLAAGEALGVISPEQRAAWRDEFYVPFYRLSEDKGFEAGQLATSGLSRQQAVKKLKGGTGNLNNLLENTMMNFHHIIDAGLKNNAARQAIENSKQLGVARQVPESRRDTATSTFVMEDGQKVYYEIDDPLVYNAITALSQTGMNSTLMKVMRGFKRVFTNTVTVTPQYIAANLLRDSIQAPATSDLSKNVLGNILVGHRTLRDQKARARMLASGANFSFGHLYGTGNVDELRAGMTRNLRDAGAAGTPGSAIPLGVGQVASVVRAGWARWNDVNNHAENLNRAAIYAQNATEGNQLRAAFEARDLMDFSSHGAWPATRVLIDIIPFLNARIQGLDKIYRSGVRPGGSVVFDALRGKTPNATDKQVAGRFWAVTGAVSLAMLALYLENRDEEWFKELEEWEKDTYTHFNIGDQLYRIPNPFEVGAIGTMMIRTAEQFLDDEATGELFAQRMGHMLTQTFAVGMPQIMQPALDVYANKDSFTNRPIENMGMQRLSPELRQRYSTTAVATGVSQLLNSTVGALGNPETNPLALSPVQVDHLIQGYLGQVGAWGAGMADTFWRASQGHEAPDRKWYEFQPIRRFYRNLDDTDPYTKYGTVFYDGLTEARRAYADVKELREMEHWEEANEIRNENRRLLMLRKGLNRAQRQMGRLNNQITMIRRSNLDGATKRQRLDRLQARKAQIQRIWGARIQEARANER
ncbi:LPD38 domain-containing protein [Halomonas sp. 1390]|uniref:LPD38 domain-containing protein n=1 Tax=Halomonas sp. B23F22_3 TaxID=3459516 RepID=UPI00373EC49B